MRTARLLDSMAARIAVCARHSQRLEREGGDFRVVPAEDVPAILPELRAVSDDWLEHKAASEKGFSLGFFDEDYLRRFPVAVHRGGGRHPSLRQPVARARARGAVGRSDAVPAHRAEGRDGRPVRSPHAVGQARGLPVVLARRGSAVGAAERAARSGVVTLRSTGRSATARRSTTSRACAPTRTSSTRCGSRATWPTPACFSCRGC